MRMNDRSSSRIGNQSQRPTLNRSTGPWAGGLKIEKRHLALSRPPRDLANYSPC
jgi:hypothetical protein